MTQVTDDRVDGIDCAVILCGLAILRRRRFSASTNVLHLGQVGVLVRVFIILSIGHVDICLGSTGFIAHGTSVGDEAVVMLCVWFYHF